MDRPAWLPNLSNHPRDPWRHANLLHPVGCRPCRMTLGTLKWLAQALGIPRPQLSPQGLPLPVATPELSFGWSGSPALYNDNNVTNQGAGAVFATVTVPDDGFYCVDASWAYSPPAAPSSRGFLVRLQILDPNGKVAWQLTDFWVISVDTAVGTLFESGKQM